MALQYATGIGALWAYIGVGAPAPNCDYIGSNARREFTAVSGCSSVPVERDGGQGTACGHWDEECMGSELMTGYSEPSGTEPLSRITVGTLQDMGYQVNYLMADPFSRSDLNSSCTCPIRRMRRRRAERSMMEMKHGEVFSLQSVIASGGTGASGRARRRRRLSEAGEAMAIEAGLEYLQSNHEQRAINDTRVDDHGVAYVGDKVVYVLFMEGGEIFGVTVRQPDE
jgi:Leishmanolysin